MPSLFLGGSEQPVRDKTRRPYRERGKYAARVPDSRVRRSSALGRFVPPLTCTREREGRQRAESPSEE